MKSWREDLKKWLKVQNGTAGYQQKLENFVERIELEAYELGKADVTLFYKINEALNKQRKLGYAEGQRDMAIEQRDESLKTNKPREYKNEL